LSYAPTGPTAGHVAAERYRPKGKRTADTPSIFPRPALLSSQNVPRSGGVWQRFLAWGDFLRLGLCGGCSAGVYPRRILAGAAANPDTSGPGIKPGATIPARRDPDVSGPEKLATSKGRSARRRRLIAGKSVVADTIRSSPGRPWRLNSSRRLRPRSLRRTASYRLFAGP